MAEVNRRAAAAQRLRSLRSPAMSDDQEEGDKKRAKWNPAPAAFFSTLIAKNGPHDMKKLQRLMRERDRSWSYTKKQLRSRVETMQRKKGGGTKRARSTTPRPAAKKPKKAFLDSDGEDGEDESESSDSSQNESSSDDEAVNPADAQILARMPICVFPTIVKVSGGFLLLIWPVVQHVGVAVKLLKDMPPRLHIKIEETDILQDQVTKIVDTAVRRCRTFDEVDDMDFTHPAPVDAATLRAAGDSALLRTAIHRKLSADCITRPPPVEYEFHLPDNVDINTPVDSVDCGALPYQAIIVRTAKNEESERWISRPPEAILADVFRARSAGQALELPMAARGEDKETPTAKEQRKAT
jgi:DNA uptake protein ComE-like DNA-binding protein